MARHRSRAVTASGAAEIGSKAVAPGKDASAEDADAFKPERPTLHPFSPERFSAPLAFKPAKNGGIGHLHPGLAQAYVLKPVTKGQKRKLGRAVLMPDLDLSSYRVDAVVDWVAVGVETDSDQPAVNVNEWIAKATGESLSVTGPGGGEGYFGRAFEAKIQDPTLDTLAKITSAIDAHPRLSCTGRLAAIEVSVDWYPHSKREEDRLLMVDLLWRQLLPPEGIWRMEGGWPRSFVGRGGGAKARDEDTQPLLASPRIVKGKDEILYAGVVVRADRELRRDLTPELHKPPAVDGTIYFGRRGGDVQIKVMHKIIDQQNRGKGTARRLGKRKRRARIEVTLRGQALEELGLTQVKRLGHFDFTKLRRRYFNFWLPTVPYHRGRASGVEDVVKGPRSRQEIDLFSRSGVLGLEVYQRGCARVVTRAQRKLNRARGRRRELQRAGKGPKGLRLAFSELEDRIYEALRRLREEWADGFLLSR